MKCYYEELGIERDANESDIKSAYRKLALRWHPDKNPDCLEEAKQQFLLIQQAYEILSDPQERAFYDNHRDQILRGKNSSYEDTSLNVFEYFTVTCFKGFGDDANGFYAVYREVFDKIATEDAEFMEDEEEINSIPSFGTSQSSYDEIVGPFYAYWSAYCTKKTYSWLCPYDIQETKDRRIIRAIDKEMKKVVQKARKERNEEVRSLVAFVRKRDKRLQEYNRKLEERVALNRQKQEQKRLEQIKKRQLQFQELQKNKPKSTFDDAYEARLKELEDQYGRSSESEDEYEEYKDYSADGDISYILEDETNENEVDEDEKEGEKDQMSENIDDLFCIACNRTYKHKRAFVDHITGQKHLLNEELLKKEEETTETGNEVVDGYLTSDLANLTTTANEAEAEIVEEEETNRKQKTKTKKGKSKSKQTFDFDINPTDGNESETALPDILLETTKLSDNEDRWEDKKNAKKRKSKKPNEVNINKTTDNAKSIDGKLNKTKVVEEPVESEEIIHACATCSKRFDSKNKLFTHLKSTNHSIYLPKSKNLNDLENIQKKDRKKKK